MLPQPIDQLLPLIVFRVAHEFVEREMYDVAVMQFFGSDFIAQFKPQAMQQVDFFWRQIRARAVPHKTRGSDRRVSGFPASAAA